MQPLQRHSLTYAPIWTLPQLNLYQRICVHSSIGGHMGTSSQRAGCSQQCPSRNDHNRRVANGMGHDLEQPDSSGVWTQEESAQHVNVIETEAVTNALRLWRSSLEGRVVTVRSDNSTTVSYINRHGTPNPLPSCVRYGTSSCCQFLGITLWASHLAAQPRVVADALSLGSYDSGAWTRRFCPEFCWLGC